MDELYFKERNRPYLISNLALFKNIAKLNFDLDDVLEKSMNEARFNLNPKKQFIYDGSQLITNFYPPSYMKILDKQFGLFLKMYNPTKKEKSILRRLFLENFADFGFLMSFCEFCFKRKIKILEIEPVNPILSNKRLDLKIEIINRPIFIEIVSPLESFIKGNDPYNHVLNKLKKHRFKKFKDPTIILLNLTNANWGNNRLNGGLVSNRMFQPISKVLKYSNIHPPELSLLLIRYGEELRCMDTPFCFNPLTEEEYNKISRPFFNQRLINLLRQI